MTKTQKIWLAIFLAMFVIPEVLWGPASGGLYLFFKIKLKPIFPDSQVLNDHFAFIILILASELIGIIGMIWLTTINKGLKKIIKGIVMTILYI